MIEALEAFLNPEFPVILGKMDLFAMIGIHDEFHDFDMTVTLSKIAWEMLKNPSMKPSFGSGQSLAESLNEDREDWADELARLVHCMPILGLDISNANPDDVAECIATIYTDSYNKQHDIEPPMSTRLHLEARYNIGKWHDFKKEKFL
jgi:hypothetical protein